jgi:hypothetical protein
LGDGVANYIDQEILCEAYTHFEVENYPTQGERDQLKGELLAFFTERAHFLFGENVEVFVEFEEGSLKTTLKVVASAAVLATTLVTAYGSFRQGVDQISKDSQMLAQSGVLEIAFRTKTAYCDRINVERRKGVFGRAHERLLQLDSVRARISGTDLPSDSKELKLFTLTVNALTKWDDQTDNLFAKLENDETKACISAGLLEELAKLPDELVWAPMLNGRGIRSQAIQANARFYGEIVGEHERYKAVAASIKKKMLLRVQQYETKNG